MCSQLIYNGSTPQIHASHLSPTWLRATISLLLLLLFLLFCWSLCVNDSQLIWKFAWHSNATYSKHVPLEFLVGHVLVHVNLCGGGLVVVLLPQIAKLPQKSQNNGFQYSWVDLSRYIAPLLNEGNIFFSLGRWFECRFDKIKKSTSISFLNYYPTIHYSHSYYNLLHNKKSMCKIEMWVVTSNLQTTIWLDLSKKNLDLQL